MKQLAMIVIFAGVILVITGAIMLAASRWQWVGHLPGDINLRGKNWSFHFPLATCVVISIILTVLLNLIARFLRK